MSVLYLSMWLLSGQCQHCIYQYDCCQTVSAVYLSVWLLSGQCQHSICQCDCHQDSVSTVSVSVIAFRTMSALHLPVWLLLGQCQHCICQCDCCQDSVSTVSVSVIVIRTVSALHLSVRWLSGQCQHCICQCMLVVQFSHCWLQIWDRKILSVEEVGWCGRQFTWETGSEALELYFLALFGPLELP